MIIFYNANIISPDYPGATAFVIDKKRFYAVGKDRDILDAFSTRAKVFNLNGKSVLPGLIDAHMHLRHLAENISTVDCETSTLQECLSRIKQVAILLPKDAWVRGHGWNHNLWAESYGNASLLDEVCGGRPAYLTAKSLHAAWVNTPALTLARIDNTTPDPPGGTIQRGTNNQPTGILFEAGAMDLIEKIIPKSNTQDIIQKIEALLPKLWKVGLVGIHDFDDFECWLALQEIAQQNTTVLRVHKQIPFNQLDTFVNAGLRTHFGNVRLNLGGVKLFSDGALGPHTAAMHAPYEGTQTVGELLVTEDEIVEIGLFSVNHGISLTIHAIGDRANHIVLNAFERIRAYEEKHHLPYLPHRIEHVQIINPEDLPRFKKLNIIASIQPIHAPSDMDMADRFLGQRSNHAYAYRSLIDAGATYVMGSDAPVESYNPFLGLYAAVTRCRLDGTPGNSGWHPEQRLSLDEALLGYTVAPCSLAGYEAELGKIAPGYYADFLILNENPFKIPSHNLGALQPVATFIAGQCLYNSSDYDFESQDKLS